MCIIASIIMKRWNCCILVKKTYMAEGCIHINLWTSHGLYSTYYELTIGGVYAKSTPNHIKWLPWEHCIYLLRIYNYILCYHGYIVGACLHVYLNNWYACLLYNYSNLECHIVLYILRCDTWVYRLKSSYMYANESIHCIYRTTWTDM